MNEQLLIAAAGLAGLAVLLLVWVLLRQGRIARDSREAARRQEQLMNEVADELHAAIDQNRGETAAELRDTGDALTRTLAQLGQGQVASLESMQRQLTLQGRAQEERIGQMQTGVTEALTRMDAEQEQLRGSVTGQLTELRRENARQLEEMRRTVDEKLTESLERRLNESYAQVARRLEQVYRGLGEMQALAGGVGDLKRMLSNVKTRGTWGEVQLGALLEQVLSPGQWEANAQIVPGSGEVVEYALRLPGREDGPLWLPIDSKFPMEDWLRLQQASERGDRAACDEARRALRSRIRLEGRRIASKYIAPPMSTDFAVMFLPVEGLYAEALSDPATVEALQRDYRVVVAGPSTLAALLNALQMGFRTLAIEKRSGEVWQLLGQVKGDFGRFSEVLEKTRQRLQQATDSIDSAFTRTRSIQRRLAAVEEDHPLPDMEPADRPVPAAEAPSSNPS